MTDQIAHLHVHTDYSMLDGAAKVSKLIARAAELGQPAVAQTDHGNMFGAMTFWETATAAGVKPILGIEAYLAPESRLRMEPVFWGRPEERDEDLGGGGSYTHITLLAETPQGVLNLFLLSSLGSLEGFYNKPRIDWELLREHHEGIIATTGCLGGEVQTLLRLDQPEKALAAAANARAVFGVDNYFLEVMDHGIPLERSLREGLLDIGRRLGIRPVATNDSHYVTEGQAEAHDALLCVGVNKKLADPKRFRFEGRGYHLKSAAEMRELWDGEVADACDNTLLIAERVQDYAEVFATRDLAPEFPVPAGETQESWLRKEVARGVRATYGETPSQEVRDRLDYELGIIVQKGYPAYFLVVADICEHARSEGIRVGPGRGSAAGSLLAFVLGITAIDPLQHELIFERFLNPERPSPPDIDLDIDERYKQHMIDYVTAKYGAAYVAQIITLGTIKAKGAVKDAARVLDYPYLMGERITKALPPSSQGHELTLADIFDTDKPPGEAAEIRTMYGDDPDVKRIVDLARGLEGLIRSHGVHAPGLVLSKQALIKVMPLHRRRADGAIIAGFEFPQIEDLGAIKMDLLSLRNLWVIDAAIKEIKANRGVEIDTAKIPLDDVKTLAMLGRGDTLGVFQLDGAAMRDLLRSMQVDAFGDVTAAVALYRPGPMGANAHNDYADRKQGRQPVIPIHPELEEVLGPILDKTYGLVVYQEQVLSVAQKVAGYSLGGADLLRRAMGKKKPEVMAKEWQKFSDGMASNGYSKESAQALWDILVPFSGYGFNKCFSGDTVITRSGRCNDWPQTARNLANRIHGRENYNGFGCRFCEEGRSIIRPETCGPCKSWRDKWRRNQGMTAVGRVGNRVMPVKVTDVFRQGVKPLWKMTLENGASLTTTMNHRHLTPSGWRRLDQLAVGDEVSTMGEGGWTSSLRTDSPGPKAWSTKYGYTIESSSIVSIEYVGEEMTYDVTVDSEDHSWVANGSIITHNSHSAPYALLAYWTGYLKANYPAEFMAALLTSVGDNKDKMALYLSEARRMGIEVLTPDVNESGEAFTAVGESRIRFGLSAVANVGKSVVPAIISGRAEGRYSSFRDFLLRAGVGNKRVVESLVKAGGFDSYGYPRQGLYVCHETAVNIVVAERKSADAGQESLFADEEEDGIGGDDEFGIGTEEWPQDVRLAFEREMLGMYVSAHPLDGMDPLLDRHRDTTIPELVASGRNEGAARVAGVISHVERKVHKASGKPWAVVTVADRDGSMEVLFATRDYPLYVDALREDALVSVKLRLNRRDEDVSYFAMELSVLEADRDPAAPVTVSVREESFNRDAMTALRAILLAHPGPAPVRMRVRRAGCKDVLMELPEYTVDPTGAFPSEIKTLLGVAALT